MFDQYRCFCSPLHLIFDYKIANRYNRKIIRSEYNPAKNSKAWNFYEPIPFSSVLLQFYPLDCAIAEEQNACVPNETNNVKLAKILTAMNERKYE